MKNNSPLSGYATVYLYIWYMLIESPSFPSSPPFSSLGECSWGDKRSMEEVRAEWMQDAGWCKGGCGSGLWFEPCSLVPGFQRRRCCPLHVVGFKSAVCRNHLSWRYQCEREKTQEMDKDRSGMVVVWHCLVNGPSLNFSFFPRARLRWIFSPSVWAESWLIHRGPDVLQSLLLFNTISSSSLNALSTTCPILKVWDVLLRMKGHGCVGPCPLSLLNEQLFWQHWKLWFKSLNELKWEWILASTFFISLGSLNF
jgi:hypothetical protein